MSRVVTFGEIMARMAAPAFKRFQQAMPGALDVTFAGAEASIAGSLAHLGASASFVTALPSHSIGDACLASLRATGIDTRHIVRTDRGRLGIYFLETGANQRSGNIIYDREGSSISVTPPEAYRWSEIFETADWFVVSGITPALSRNAAEVTALAIKEASSRGVKIAIDMNYRSKLWQWDPPLSARELATRTMRALIPSADLFIGGREDAEAILNLETSLPLEDLVREITRKFPNLQRVAMTLRSGNSASTNHFGGLLYEKDSDMVAYAPKKEVLYPITNIVDRIGTGDAFSAALIFALITPELASAQSAIALATAAGCLAHSIEGDLNLNTRGEIESLMGGDSGGRVRR